MLVVLDLTERKGYLKIIDYLRMYDLAKNVESKWKQMRSKDSPTIVETNLY